MNTIISNTRTAAYWGEKLQGQESHGFTFPMLSKEEQGALEITFSTEETTLLKKISKGKSINIYKLGLVALYSVVQRYTGKDSMSFVSGKYALPELDSIQNSQILLTIHRREDNTAKTLLKEVHQEMMESIRHADFNLKDLLDEEVLGRMISFDMEGFTQNAFQKDVELAFEMREKADRYVLDLKWRSSFVTNEISFQLANHFRTALIAIISDLNASVDSLPIVTEKAVTEPLEGVVLAEDIDFDLGFVKRFEEQVAQNPKSVAIDFEGDKWTYQLLNQEANKVANGLIVKGIQSNDKVGLMMDRSGRLVVAMLGILKAGAAYVPVDFSYPDARKKNILESSGCKVLLTDEKSLNLGCETINPDTLSGSKENPGIYNQGTDLLYIIYSSGTTGKPKGIMVNHKSILNLLSWYEKRYQITKETRIVHITNAVIDIAFQEIFSALMVGATLYIPEEQTSLDHEQFVMYLKENEITFIQVIPDLLRTYFSQSERISSIQHILVGGDKLGDKLRDQIVAKGYQLYNVYGQTETAIDSVVSDCSVGKHFNEVIQGYQLYILDEKQRVCPANTIGEICTGGIGLADGYLGNEELTNNKFVQNPFGEGRLYRTGDLGRRLNDGSIEFIGRLDSQIKIRGFQVELNDVEKRINNHPNVKEVVVIADKFGGEKELAAYVLATEPVTVESLIAAMGKDVSRHMIPSFFVQVDRFPVSMNGKIDKKNLPNPIENCLVPEDNQPETETEATILEIWKEVLGRQNVGLTANFFEIGGHSLRVVKLVSAYNKKFGVQVSMKDLFESVSIREHATLIEQQGTVSFSEIPVTETKELYRVSDAQRRMWVMSQLESTSSAYNMFNSVEIQDTLGVEALQKAINQLVQHHEILRTTFLEKEDELWQKVSEEVSIKLEMSTVKSMEEVTSSIQKDAFLPFDLAKGPLLRMKVYQLSEDHFVLYYNMHHIISDGWSMDLLEEQVVSCYKAVLEGRDCPLKPLRIQHKDYTSWLENQQEFKSQQAYWHDKLKGDLPITEFPTLQKRPAQRSYKGHAYAMYLEKELLDSLKQYSLNQGGTLFMGLLGVIKGLLYRYTAQEDLIVGTTVAGRHHDDLTNQIGLFLNTVPLRTSIGEEGTFENLFQLVKETTLNAFENQSYPFDKILNDLQVRQDLSRAPLFDIMVVLQNTGEETSWGVNTLEIIDMGAVSCKYDLSFDFRETTQGLFLNVEYCTEVYAADFISRLMTNFKQLLSQVLQSPEKTLDELSLVEGAERAQILEVYNASIEQIDCKENLVSTFEKQVSLKSGFIAVCSEEESVTYGQLNEWSNKVADCLIRDHEVSKGDFVAVVPDRSPLMIVAILGVLKAGAAFVPISPDYPQKRIDHIVTDSNCKTLLTEEELKRIIVRNYSSENPEIGIEADDLAYMIYTSGSTGEPKGVMQEHGAVINLVNWFNRHYGITENDRVAKYVNVAFDVTIQEIFPCLLTGATLEIVPKEIMADAEALATFVNKKQVSVLALPVIVAVEMAQYPVTSLRHLIVGGDQFVSLGNQPYRVHNQYGPTEATVTCSTIEVIEEQTEISIGSPITNVQMYVLNKKKQLQPIDAIGELYIAGNGVSRGYWGNSDLTEEKFVDCPFTNGRMYKTGDLGRWLPNGTVDFIGRVDYQVKIRGNRVELGEIEKVLLQHKSVRDAVVIAVGEEVKELVAYVIGESSSDLRFFLKSRLPEYMIPSAFVELERFPQTPNGKVDYRSLPSPTYYTENEFVAPSGTLEEQIVNIWKSVLHQDIIGVTDGFFELGGNSLKAVKLIGQYRKQLGKKIALADVYSHPTVREQAALLNIVQRQDLGNIPKCAEKEKYTLSPSQKRMWMVDQISGNGNTYNILGKYEFQEAIDSEILEMSLQYLVNRHEVMRTVFEEQEGEVYQRILNASESVVKLAPFTGDEQAFYKQTFLLDQWPLFQFEFMKSETSPVLYYNIHHIITDGWSVALFIRELSEVYSSLLSGKEPGLEQLPIQYKDYAEWAVENTDQEASQIYWKNQLGGELPKLQLPIDYATSVRTEPSTGIYDFYFSEALTQGISKISTQYQVSAFAVIEAAFKVVLHKITGNTDVIVGVPVANRDQEEIQKVLGFFLNTVMLRDSVSPNQSFEELLTQVNKNLVNGLEHQSYPFEKVLEEIQVGNDFSTFPVSSVFLNMLNFNDEEKNSIPEFKKEHKERPSVAVFELECYFRKFNNGMIASCVYKSELFRPETVEYWMNGLESVLKQVVENHNVQVEGIHPFPTIAQEQSVAEGEFNPEATIPELFDRAVHLYGDRTAILESATRITYNELNAKANGIALEIRKQIPEGFTRIGLFLQHGTSSISGMLGVLKSGNAYVPIDTHTPQERIMQILEDAGCEWVLKDKGSIELNKDMNCKVLNIDELKPEQEAPEMEQQADDLAYILYTSGSTGKPKGVMQNHRNVNHFMNVYATNLQITSQDVLSLLPSYTFDASVMDIYGALFNGACLCPYNVKESGTDALKTWMLSNEISIFHVVPTVYRHFIHSLDTEMFELVRLVVFGGEAVCLDDFKSFKKHFSKQALMINGYGPTESTITMQNFIQSDAEITTIDIPVGKPVARTTVYVLDEKNKPVDVYQTGEIVYKSDYIALGYWNNEAATNAAFVNDPLTGEGIVYRSGDMGQWMPDGTLKFIGRKDSQVKLNGVRIETGEVEHHVKACGGVKEAVVLKRTIEGREYLVAYVVGVLEGSVEECRMKMTEALPFVMIPSYFVTLDQFPQTQSGKIDRKLLPDPVMEEKEFTSAETKLEKELVVMWSELLNINPEEISVHASFFELGGQSLKVIQLLSRVLQKYGVKVEAVSMFTQPTVYGLAAEIEKYLWAKNMNVIETEDEIETFTI